MRGRGTRTGRHASRRAPRPLRGVLRRRRRSPAVPIRFAQPPTFGLDRISEMEIGKKVPGLVTATELGSQLLDGDPKR